MSKYVPLRSERLLKFLKVTENAPSHILAYTLKVTENAPSHILAYTLLHDQLVPLRSEDLPGFYRK